MKKDSAKEKIIPLLLELILFFFLILLHWWLVLIVNLTEPGISWEMGLWACLWGFIDVAGPSWLVETMYSLIEESWSAYSWEGEQAGIATSLHLDYRGIISISLKLQMCWVLPAAVGCDLNPEPHATKQFSLQLLLSEYFIIETGNEMKKLTRYFPDSTLWQQMKPHSSHNRNKMAFHIPQSHFSSMPCLPPISHQLLLFSVLWSCLACKKQVSGNIGIYLDLLEYEIESKNTVCTR